MVKLVEETTEKGPLLMEKTPNDYITIGELAELGRVSPSTARRWVDAGTIPARLLPSGYRQVLRADAERFVATLRRGGENADEEEH